MKSWEQYEQEKKQRELKQLEYLANRPDTDLDI